jgi:hypothetical protein
MEIFSYVLDGALAHEDSMGTGSVIRPGDVQMMSAGTGIRHSEFNASNSAPVHFLQIWIVPDRQGVEPRYQQRHFSAADKRGRLRLIISPDGADGSLGVPGRPRVCRPVRRRRAAHPHPAAGPPRLRASGPGQLVVNGQPMQAGDGARLRNAERIEFSQGEKPKCWSSTCAPTNSPISDPTPWREPHEDPADQQQRPLRRRQLDPPGRRHHRPPEGRQPGRRGRAARPGRQPASGARRSRPRRAVHPAEQRTPEQAARVALDDALIAQVQSADAIVLGVPMYNFGVPVQLKTWIDAIARAGVTFRYTENGPEGLLKGKKVYVALARGGIYRDTPADSRCPTSRACWASWA